MGQVSHLHFNKSIIFLTVYSSDDVSIPSPRGYVDGDYVAFWERDLTRLEPTFLLGVS